MKKLISIFTIILLFGFCHAQVKNNIKQTTVTGPQSKRSNQENFIKLNQADSKNTQYFEQSKSLWSDWITSEEYPKDIQVRYSLIKYNVITMEVKNTGYGTVVGELSASDCPNDNGNSSGYKKISLESGKVQKVSFSKSNCNSTSTVRWWWKNLFVWSPKKEITIGWTNITNYKGVARWAKNGNNQFILEFHLTEGPVWPPDIEKFSVAQIRGKITACFCSQPYSYINGWQNLIFSVGNIYYFDFIDKSVHCGWETKNDLNITIQLDKNQY